jgi:hypothetical protein
VTILKIFNYNGGSNMKKYIKPTFEVVKLIPEERMALSGGGCVFVSGWSGDRGNGNAGCVKDSWSSPRG